MGPRYVIIQGAALAVLQRNVASEGEPHALYELAPLGVLVGRTDANQRFTPHGPEKVPVGESALVDRLGETAWMKHEVTHCALVPNLPGHFVFRGPGNGFVIEMQQG